MYAFAGRPDRVQETVTATLDQLWSDAPEGIPGNDDLGEMSSWYVWASLGMYPLYPGRAELVLTKPRFRHIEITRPLGRITIDVEGAALDAGYIQSVQVDGQAHTAAYLAEPFVYRGGEVAVEVGASPHPTWGREHDDGRPPSFPPPAASR